MPLRTILEPVYTNTRWTLLLYNLLAPKVQVSFRDFVRYSDLVSSGFFENVEASSELPSYCCKAPRPDTPTPTSNPRH